MNGNIRNSFFISALLIIALTLVGCSSSNDNSDSGNTGGTTSRIAVGAMTKGSVILNGVRFEDTAANIIADDTPKTAAFLEDGMTVKVKGTVSADGRSGVAEAVEVVSEARGAVVSKNLTGDILTVHNQSVLVDGGTVLAGGPTSIADLSVNDNIEVHGGRDDTGVIHATRVQKLPAGAVADEVRGPVSGKTATTFNIGSLPITFNANAVVPAGAAFVNGDVVEVHLSGGTATRIAVEHLNHPEFEAAEGGELSFQGILVGFSETGTFKVDTQQVKLVTGARIEGGVLADLIDGMKVEAEGHTTTGGVLNAEKITIKDNIRLEANATTVGDASMMGKTVKITTGTRLDNLASGPSITVGDGLRVRGFVNRDGSTITATRVTKLSNPVDTRRFIVQGPVTSKDDATRKLVILGITVDASGASGVDDSGTSASVDQIFSSTTAGETIIKARGTVTGSTMVADELEFE